jgi:hypothetical protein
MKTSDDQYSSTDLVASLHSNGETSFATFPIPDLSGVLGSTFGSLIEEDTESPPRNDMGHS